MGHHSHWCIHRRQWPCDPRRPAYGRSCRNSASQRTNVNRGLGGCQQHVPNSTCPAATRLRSSRSRMRDQVPNGQMPLARFRWASVGCAGRARRRAQMGAPPSARDLLQPVANPQQRQARIYLAHGLTLFSFVDSGTSVHSQQPFS